MSHLPPAYRGAPYHQPRRPPRRLRALRILLYAGHHHRRLTRARRHSLAASFCRAACRNRTDDLFITSEFWRLPDLRRLRANALSSCENVVPESLEEPRRVWP